jgi:membrane-associated protein
MSDEPTAAAQTGTTASAAAGDARPANPWNDPRLPWNGKPGRADILCWGGIVLSGFYYLALLPFRADLVGTHPLLGTLLNGATESIVSAAAFARTGHGSIPVVILVAIFGLMKFDVLYWWAGRLWGERVILLLSGRRKSGPKAIARVHKWGRRFTWPAMVVAPFVPIPSAIIYVVAGWAGMSVGTFLVLDLISMLLWAGMLVGLGYALGHHAVVVAQTISHYGLWVSIGIVVLVIVSQLRSVRMHR